MIVDGTRTPRVRLHRAFTLLELVIVLGVILVLLGLVLGVGSVVVGQSEQRQLTASMTVVDTAISEFEAQTGRPIIFQGELSASRPGHCGYRNGTPNGNVYFDVPYSPFNDERFTADIQDGGMGWGAGLSNCPPWDGSSASVRRQWLAATLAVLEQNPTCAEIVTKADPTLVHAVSCIVGGSGSAPTIRALDIKEFVDPWGQQVYIIFPGRLHDAGDTAAGRIMDDDGTIRTTDETRFGICRNRRPLLVSSGADSRFGELNTDTFPPGSDEFEDALDNIYSYEPDQR